MADFRKACLRAALSVAACCLVISSCSKGTGSGEEDVGNTPYNIIDLRLQSITDSSITLCWTATGDDANVGTATTYDLRTLMSDPITDENWDSAYQYAGEPYRA